MNNNNEFKQAYSKVILISWIISIVVTSLILCISLIFYFGKWYKFPIYWYSWPLSYFLGTMVNLFAFNLLKNNIASLNKDNNSIFNSSSNYLIRLFIYGFILFIAFNNEKLNPYFVFVGFINVKIAIYIYSFSERKKIERRR